MKTLLPFFLFLLPIVLFSQNKFKQYNLEELDSICNQETTPKTKLFYALIMLKKAKTAFGEQDTSYAKILNKVGRTYLDIDLDSSLFYVKKALKIQEVKIPKHLDYIKSLNNIGIAYYYLINLKKAEKYWLKAASICKEVLGEKHQRYLGLLGNLGNIYMDLGAYQKAIRNYTQVKTFFEAQDLTTNKYYLISLTNLGQIYEKITAYEKAEHFYLQSLKKQKHVFGEKDPTYLITLGYLANLYKRLGNYEKAERFLLQVVSLKKEILGEKHYSYTGSLANLANLYMNLKQYEKAEHFYLKEMEITKTIYGDKHIRFATSITSLGLLHATTKNYKKAEHFYLQSMALKKEKYGTKHPDYLYTLTILAQLYSNIKQYKKAEALYLQTYSIYTDIFSKKNTSVITNLNNLGLLYYHLNQPDLAWKYVLRSIAYNTDLTMRKNINRNWMDRLLKADCAFLDDMNTSLSLIYELLAKDNEYNTKKQQIIICDLALKLLQKKKNSFDVEHDKLRILSKNANWILRSMEVLDKEKDVHKALNIIEQNKSVLLLGAINNKRIYQSGFLPDSILLKEKKLTKKYAKIKASLAQKCTNAQLDSLRNAFMELNFQISDFQQSIKKNYPKYATIKYQYEAIQAQEIQLLLDDKTAMLEYLIGDSIVYIFYIDKKEVNIYEFPIANENLNEHIHSLRNALNGSEVSENNRLMYYKYSDQAYWFYKNLVAPALSNKKNINQLIIVPDGELGHLPFEAFLMKEASEKDINYTHLDYLIKQYKISYNYSATLWKENKSNFKNNNNGQVLGIVADYKEAHFSIPNNRLSIDKSIRKQLQPLINARKEVETLSKDFKGFFAFEEMATERLFKEKAANFSVIHLAMHSILNQQEPILSSLAFTENNDSLENNFLHAYEIAKMDLNADLVVLSACETGFGRFERGNGIASLARAFMYAGAPAMIVSLWQVNDYTTSLIMKNLYNNLANGMNKDEALRQTKISYINHAEGAAAHPAFWSSFILIGSEDSISIARKSTLHLWGIGGLILILVLSLLLRIKQR